MSYMIIIVLTLIFALAVLAVAIVLIRHQRLVAEMKARFVNCRKQRDFHNQRYLTYQADLDRQRVSYNAMMKELLHIKSETVEARKEIREILEILKEETRGLDEQMRHDLSRIIERRKDIVNKQWKEVDGKKALLIEKMAQALAEKSGQEALLLKKDEEFRKLSEINAELVRLKRDYEHVLHNPVFSFGKKRR